MVARNERGCSISSGAQWLLAIIATGLVLLMWALVSVAHAGETRQADIATLKGQTIDIYAVVCITRRDANVLLSHLRRGGAAEALTYVRDHGNTCALDSFEVVVGPVLATTMAPDGGAWNMVAAASTNGRAHAFMVTSKMLSAVPQTTTSRT